jgi:hypothetical protein
MFLWKKFFFHNKSIVVFLYLNIRENYVWIYKKYFEEKEP